MKKTYETIQKIINWCNVCTKCQRTEKDLVGVTFNTIVNINIFSVEGLCIDCEIDMYPERFHGCGFCKRPIREKFCCTTCSNGFIDWVNNYVHPMTGLSEIIKWTASDLVNRTIYDLPEIEKHRFILRNNDGYYKWPGFYAGVTDRFTKKSCTIDKQKITNDNIDKNTTVFDIHLGYGYTDVEVDSFVNTDDDTYVKGSHTIFAATTYTSNHVPVWIIPRVFNQPCFDFADLKLELNPFQNRLLFLLESNGIYLYSNAQINAETINLEQIVKVNPFDTRIIKNIYVK